MVGGGRLWGFVVEEAAAVAGEARCDFVSRVHDFDLDLFVRGEECGLDFRVHGRGLQLCACSQDESAEGEVVEDLAAIPPDVRAAVFAQAFIVEAVHGRDLSRFVVASYQCDAIWIPDFEAEEEEEAFEGVEPAIDEIAHEEVVGVWDVSADSEEFHQVVELSMDVSAYCYWGVDLDHIAFFYEELARFMAEVADGGFGDGFAGAEIGYCSDLVC